jgi:hypothetical protein
MAKRVTPEDIITINETYLLCGSYSATAKATGWSASTVAKYVDKNYKSSVEGAPASPVQPIEPAALDVALEYLLNHSNLSCLTEQERADMKTIWKGMLV